MSAQVKGRAGGKRLGASVLFAPLGGVEEVGMNAALYGVGTPGKADWILVDCGLGFVDESSAPGIDVCIPDLDFVFRQGLHAIFITHAHEDHIGALGYFARDIDVPVYMTRFAKALFEARWPGLRDSLTITTVRAGDQIEAGPFSVTYLEMPHSIPESNGLVLKTPEAVVFHSGDWKIDRREVKGMNRLEATLRALRKEATDLTLVCDSTNAAVSGSSPSEDEVGDVLRDVVGEARGAVGVTLFASNVRRLESICEAAQAAGRVIVPLGRAVDRVLTVAMDCGYIASTYDVRDHRSLASLSRAQTLVILSGSQGERSAALARAAEGRHPAFRFRNGDRMIFSSRTIPGNELRTGAIINQLLAMGVEIITSGARDVHVSGHPRRGELKRLYAWLQPDKLVPVHGERRHLEAQLDCATQAIDQSHVPRNGVVLSLGPGPKVEAVDDLPVDRLFVDGRLLFRDSEPTISERRRLALSGLVSLMIVLDERGDLRAPIACEAVGLPSRLPDGQDFAKAIACEADRVLGTLPPKTRKSKVEKSIKLAVKSFCSAFWGKRPEVLICTHDPREGTR